MRVILEIMARRLPAIATNYTSQQSYLHLRTTTSAFTTVTDPSQQYVGLLGLCEDRNSSFCSGAAQAPPLIRELFLCDSGNSYSETGVNVHNAVSDFGDVYSETNTIASMQQSISSATEEMMLKRGLAPLFLGGDHSVSAAILPVVKACLNRMQDNKLGECPPLVIVHFDAHPDVYPLFQNNPSSHASPFIRILEEQGLCKQLISIGIRTATAEQWEQLRKYSVCVVEARDMPAKGSDLSSLFKEHIQADTLVYISFDIDVLDPVRFFP